MIYENEHEMLQRLLYELNDYLQSPDSMIHLRGSHSGLLNPKDQLKFDEELTQLNDKIKHLESMNELINNYSQTVEKEKKELQKQIEKYRQQIDQMVTQMRKQEGMIDELKQEKAEIDNQLIEK